MRAIKTIRIIIADDHRLFREALQSLFQQLPEVEVVGEAQDGRTAVALARELLPDVVVMDIAMPDLNGIEATRQLMASGNSMKIIALSGRTTPRAATEMLQAGAAAFVCKESAFDELKDALHAVMNSRVYVSPALAEIVAAKLQEERGDKKIGLSGREREVLQLMAEGQATKEVARTLKVSAKTVETHRRNLMEKLQLDSVAQLTKYAIREGITSA